MRKSPSKKAAVGGRRRIAAAFFALVLASAPFLSFSAPNPTTLEEVDAQRSELQKQLAELQKQIASDQKELSSLKKQRNTLVNRLSQLKKEQDILKLEIKYASYHSELLEGQIKIAQADVESNRERADLLREKASELIRRLSAKDDIPLELLMIARGNLSGAVEAKRDYLDLVTGISASLSELRAVKAELAARKSALMADQDSAMNSLSVKYMAQSKLADSVSSQNGLLAKTKGKESAYQAELTASQKKAAEIKSRLYQLLEVSEKITFGQAVSIAKWASAQTGVRPAFLLAVLTQESNLGKNVGTCNRAGDPPSKSWKAVMKPERDQGPFLQITSKLGRNPDTTPVSCPMKDSKGNQIGWGGAMGPAQFIPSTWMGYMGRITAITGKAADPWDIRDAFLAAGLKLAADGAKSQSGEWSAAMKYFSGSTNSAYRFYGDSVVSIAEGYEKDIKEME